MQKKIQKNTGRCLTLYNLYRQTNVLLKCALDYRGTYRYRGCTDIWGKQMYGGPYKHTRAFKCMMGCTNVRGKHTDFQGHIDVWWDIQMYGLYKCLGEIQMYERMYRCAGSIWTYGGHIDTPSLQTARHTPTCLATIPEGICKKFYFP